MVQIGDFTASHESDYCAGLMADMWQHQLDGRFTDVVLRVKDKVIAGHRIVLFSACPALLQLRADDNPELGKPEIALDSLDPYVLSEVVKYLYGQNNTFSSEYLAGLLAASRQLDIQDLFDQLAAFMLQHLTLEVALQWWKLSRQYEMSELRREAVQLMARDIVYIGATDEFRALHVEDLISLIEDADMDVRCRDDLLTACMEWVKAEPDVRKGSTLNIVKSVQLEKCTLNMLKTLAVNYHELVHDARVLSFILAETFRRELIESGKLKTSLIILGGMMTGWEGHINNKCYVSRQIGTFQWEEFAEIPEGIQARGSPIITYNGGFLVLCGGKNHRVVSKYDAIAKAWTELPPCPESLKDAAGVMCNNSVYLLGGDGPLDAVWRLHLATLTWSQRDKMLVKQAWPIACAVGNEIFVIYNNNNGPEKKHIRLQHHDTQGRRSSWTNKAALPANAPATWGACMVNVGDALYLIGGSRKMCVRYDIKTDAWTLLSPPTLQHNYGSAAVFGGKILLIGHCYNQRNAPTVEHYANNSMNNVSVYTMDTDEWSVVPANIPMEGFCFFKAGIVEWL